MRANVDDGTRVHGASPGPVRPGEVMVTRRYHAVAFPAVVDGGLHGVIDHEHDHRTRGGDEQEVTVRVRESVAQWIGVYAEMHFGDDVVRWEWRGELLVIHDDRRDGDLLPRTVEPDAEGRYALTEPWLGVSDRMVARMAAQHREALAILAGDQPPSLTSPMLRYLSQPLTLRAGDALRWQTDLNLGRVTEAVTRFVENQGTSA